jgi:transcriptional regulator with XRE-family HTH domain
MPHLTVVTRQQTLNNARVVDPLVGARIVQLRQRKGWRQKDLAARAGVAPNTVAGLEHGKQTRWAKFEQIATALGVTTHALQTGEGLSDDNPLAKKLRAPLRTTDDVGASIARSIRKLPELGRRNPDAALLIEREIDDYMPAPDAPPDPAARPRLPNLVVRNARHWAQEGRQRVEEARARIAISRRHIVQTQRRNQTSVAYALALDEDPDPAL